MATRRIAFTTASDGLRLAFGVHGSGGPAVVKAANWMTHLEHDWQSPVWRHWLEEFGAHHTLVHYDERGCGLSDRHVEDDAFTLAQEGTVNGLLSQADVAGSLRRSRTRSPSSRRGGAGQHHPPRRGRHQRVDVMLAAASDGVVLAFNRRPAAGRRPDRGS